MKNDLYSKGRSVSDLKAHLVLTTKYRRKVFTGTMIERLHEIFAGLLEQQDCRLVSFDGEQDHIHLLFQYHPDIHLSKLVNSLKSVSSRKMRVEFGSELSKTYYKKPVLWNSSYFIASCGGVTISVLKKYIDSQDTPDG
ncbi:IS200/IS605 family transposase [Dapis sp. BLCC M229]|uniref:IS200/IS605 family transposase n=1 Tax=Dapis sp. BLCC M229 TaxID=3400188 RepID=UPI003CFB51A4